MSSKTLFFIGATGYIGGTVFNTIHDAHPDLHYRLLVRSEEKGQVIKKKYPKVETVIGDLDTADVLASEAEKADIVVATANCDHEAHVQSIYKGLAKHNGTAFYIHTSGTGVLIDPTPSKAGHATQSDLSTKRYDDLLDIDAIINLPDSQLHVPVDKFVRDKAPQNVKFAIVCPPLIYGDGTGPGNTNSQQVPMVIQATKKLGHGFTMNGSENGWHVVHVVDLANVYNLLVTAALDPSSATSSTDHIFGREAYYFAESEKIVFKELNGRVAEEMKRQGEIESGEVKDYTGGLEDLKAVFGEEGSAVPLLTGTNSFGTASRARKVLKWKPKEDKLYDTLAGTVKMTLEK